MEITKISKYWTKILVNKHLTGYISQVNRWTCIPNEIPGRAEQILLFHIKSLHNSHATKNTWSRYIYVKFVYIFYENIHLNTISNYLLGRKWSPDIFLWKFHWWCILEFWLIQKLSFCKMQTWCFWSALPGLACQFHHVFHVDPKEHFKLSQFNPAVQRGATEKNIQSLITVNTMVFKQNYNDDKIFRCLTWYHVKIPAFDMQCTWIFSFTFPHFCHLWNGCHYEELRETANREVCMEKVLSNDEFY